MLFGIRRKEGCKAGRSGRKIRVLLTVVMSEKDKIAAKMAPLEVSLDELAEQINLKLEPSMIKHIQEVKCRDF